jgi:hypothetical protein
VVDVNRSVPTLLGIMIVLMVAVLVVLIYDLKVTAGLASGKIVVGTVGGRLISGVDGPVARTGMVAAPGSESPRVGRKTPPVAAQQARGRQGQALRANRRAWERRGTPGGSPKADPGRAPGRADSRRGAK